MKNSQPQLSSIRPPPEILSSPSSMTTHSDHRHSLVAGKFRAALFSAIAANYSTNGSGHSLPFFSEKFKSVIDCRLHENFPSFHTPTHLPYASMIQRAIAEGGEEDGLSEESISEFIVNEYKDLPWAHPAFLRRHLVKLCETGELVKLKCGRYNFQVEGKEVKRKKRRRNSVGRSRRQEVESADELEKEFDRKKRSNKVLIVGPRAEEVVTSKGTEEQSDLLREVNVGVENVDHAQGGQVVLDELEEVQVDVMIDKQHGEKFQPKYRPKVFNRKRPSRTLVILGLHAPTLSGSLGEVHGAEEGDHMKGGQVQVLGEDNEVRIVGMVNDQHELEVKSRGGVEDFGRRKQSQDQMVAGLCAKEVLMTEGTEDECSLSRKKVDGAEANCVQTGQIEALGKLKEVQVEMIDEHRVEERQGELMEEPKERASMGSNGERWPVEEATLEFFDAMSNHSNAEENGLIDDAGSCKKFQVEFEKLEIFDARSDYGYNGVNEIIGAQSSKEMLLGEVGNSQNELKEQCPSEVSDDQTGVSKGSEAVDCRLSPEPPHGRWPSEITGIFQKHSEQEKPRTEVDKSENSVALLPAVIISSPSRPQGHRGRGRPRKLKVQETSATVEDRETSGPNTGDGTHHVDQQRLNLPRGRGRGRGRPRVVRQDHISGSETFSPSNHLHHQQSSEKRRGRPPKPKFDEDTVSKHTSISLENEQQEHKRRGRGRGRGRGTGSGRKQERESFDNQ